MEYATKKIDRKTTLKVVKRIWFYVKRYPGWLAIVALSIILTSAFSLALPIILEISIDTYLDADEINMMAITWIALSVIIVSVFIGYMYFLQGILMAKTASLATKDIRKEAFDKMVLLPVGYFDQNAHGDIMSKVTNDVETIFNALAQVIPQMITAIITITGAIVMMFITSWLLALVALGVIPIMALLTIFITRKSAKHFRLQQEKLGVINGIVEEDIVGLKVVKLYNQEQPMIDKFEKASEELRRASFRGQLYTGMVMPLIRLIDNILYGLLVTVGAILFINPNFVMTVGKIQAMINYTRMSTRPINSLAQIVNVMQMAIAGGDRIFELIDQVDEFVDNKTKTLDQMQGNVCFNDVTFHYVPNKTVLHNVSFSIDKGKTIAIVGPTGGGKTTIINLLSRYYDTQEGDISIDGVSIYDLDKTYLRKKVGIVLQTTYLFKGTVLENIRYGNPKATFEEVVEAAKLAHVHDIIERLPRKYETNVKEGGSNFSHGERQLLSIARTILYNPSILVLDEATSSVDTRTEINIQKSMLELMKNRTSFVIAHRLKTIKNANMILVINDGRIIERGTHQELLEKHGMYYTMYTTQFGLQE